ncbi:hypothetical protein [Sporosarcina sp. P20a]|nr:hypothetical protein [Sporosarcina sp. P20a]
MLRFLYIRVCTVLAGEPTVLLTDEDFGVLQRSDELTVRLS